MQTREMCSSSKGHAVKRHIHSFAFTDMPYAITTDII